MGDGPGLALVTGASAGIGRELARVFASRGHDVVLVARRAERLEALAAEIRRDHGVAAHARPADLVRDGAAAGLAAWCRGRDLRVSCLVNNAGSGLTGTFAAHGREATLDMVRLNVLALTDLTHTFLAEMLERGSGRILNVASTAAFQAGPRMAVYFATKAYVLHFTEALAVELRGTGVTATALCPGMTESEFHARAGYSDDSLVVRLRRPAGKVARAGYRGMMRGRPIVVPGAFNRLGTLAVRLVPRALVRGAIHRVQKKHG
jgi:short-subunit dehydrogenase